MKKGFFDGVKVYPCPIQNHDVGNIFWNLIKVGIETLWPVEDMGNFKVEPEKGRTVEQDCVVIRYKEKGQARIYSYELLITKGYIEDWLFGIMGNAVSDYYRRINSEEKNNTT